jgi:hypothetical protein
LVTSAKFTFLILSFGGESSSLTFGLDAFGLPGAPGDHASSLSYTVI